MTAIARRPARAALALAALLAASTLAVGTGAFVADEQASAGNAAGAATFDLAGTADGTGLLPDLTIRPGQAAREGTTVLRNDGSVPGELYVRLSVPASASTALVDALRVQLLACRDAGCTTFDRVLPAAGLPDDWAPLSQLRTRIALGTLAPGAEVRYRTRVMWPATQDDPALYGASAGETRLRWSLRTPTDSGDGE